MSFVSSIAIKSIMLNGFFVGCHYDECRGALATVIDKTPPQWMSITTGANVVKHFLHL